MKTLKRFYKKHISETKKLKDNPIFSILIFLPASFITAILIIPAVIISYPLIYIFKKQELKIMRVGLFIQHSLGLSAWLIIEEILISRIFSFNWSFGWLEVVINGSIAFIIFYNSIKEMIHETLNNTYGDNWS